MPPPHPCGQGDMRGRGLSQVTAHDELVRVGMGVRLYDGFAGLGTISSRGGWGVLLRVGQIHVGAWQDRREVPQQCQDVLAAIVVKLLMLSVGCTAPLKYCTGQFPLLYLHQHPALTIMSPLHTYTHTVSPPLVLLSFTACIMRRVLLLAVSIVRCAEK